jgi:D-3-phosphoglycerate dehydrogenase / 2-oxoglutarate reductase
MKHQYPALIFDYDSTIVRVESLDVLADIVLEHAPDREERVRKIEEITRLGMNGEISFPDSLASRLAIFRPHIRDIDRLVERLRDNISPSVIRNKDFFHTYQGEIHIISGGFKEFITPVTMPLGIKEENVHANSFIWGEDGYAEGIDRDCFLAQEGGKIKALKALGLDCPVYAIGDGSTDAQLTEAGATFIYFGENVFRPQVAARTEFQASCFEDFLEHIKYNDFLQQREGILLQNSPENPTPPMSRR